MDWLSSLTSWLSGILQSFLDILLHLLTYLVVVIIDVGGAAIIAVFNLFALPSVIKDYGFSSLYELLPPGTDYFVQAVHLDTSVTIIVAAVLVRIVRKVSTLFQW